MEYNGALKGILPPAKYPISRPRTQWPCPVGDPIAKTFDTPYRGQ